MPCDYRHKPDRSVLAHAPTAWPTAHDGCLLCFATQTKSDRQQRTTTNPDKPQTTRTMAAAALPFSSLSIARSSLRRISTHVGRRSVPSFSNNLSCASTARTCSLSGRSACRLPVSAYHVALNHAPRSNFSSSVSSSSSSSIESRRDALTSSDGVVGYPIDFDTASSIEGKESQVGPFQLIFEEKFLDSQLMFLSFIVDSYDHFQRTQPTMFHFPFTNLDRHHPP